MLAEGWTLFVHTCIAVLIVAAVAVMAWGLCRAIVWALDAWEVRQDTKARLRYLYEREKRIEEQNRER